MDFPFIEKRISSNKFLREFKETTDSEELISLIVIKSNKLSPILIPSISNSLISSALAKDCKLMRQMIIAKNILIRKLYHCAYSVTTLKLF